MPPLLLCLKGEFIMKEYDKPFFCYSKKLRDELTDVGIRYVAIGKHDKTGNPYWLYMPDERLNEFLQRRREKFK